MKKLMFSAIVFIAFAGVSLAKAEKIDSSEIKILSEISNIEVICSPECSNLASAKMAKYEAIYGCEEDSSLYNARWEMYYGMCERGVI